MPSELRQAWRTLRREGPAHAWFKALHEIDVYRRLAITERQARPPNEDSTIDVSCEVLPPEALDLYLAFRPEQDREEIRSRFAAGHTCQALRHAGEIVANTWFGPGPIRFPYLDCELELAPDAAYVYDQYVTPALRGRRVASAFAGARYPLLRQGGFSRTVSDFWPENTSSWKRVGRRGHRIVAWLSRLRIGPWSHLFLRRGPEADGPLPVWWPDSQDRP